VKEFKPLLIRSKQPAWRKWLLISTPLFAVLIYLLYRFLAPGASSGRWAYYRALLLDRESLSAFISQPGMRCGDSVFAFPTTGAVIGLWDQSYRAGHRQQGLDIFSGTSPGVTPIYAAYSGYLTRLGDWSATVIIRIPQDPLQPDRQIWNYYTHMATRNGNSFIADQFPPGASEIFVEEGTFLGYQGDYSGDPLNPTGLHLHFSVVKDYGRGGFLNELEISNTLDPSPYCNLAVNHNNNADEILICEHEIEFTQW
jgi:murein DD-endopeptidase MepM/ murein hydrolase activator NlpD